jgi:antitoxin PrlF
LPAAREQLVEMGLVIPLGEAGIIEGLPMNAVTSKGQVTIPKAIRDALDIHPGSKVEFTVNRQGEIVLRRAGSEQQSPSRFDRFVGSAGPGMTTGEIMALMRGDD